MSEHKLWSNSEKVRPNRVNSVNMVITKRGPAALALVLSLHKKGTAPANALEWLAGTNRELLPPEA